MTTLTVTLPFSPYRVEVALGRRTYTVNLSANSADLRGSYFGRSPAFRSILVSRGKQEMKDTAYALTRDAMMAPGRTRMPQTGLVGVRLSCTITTRTRARKDRDGAIAGLKAAFDGIAQALGVDDSLFEVASVEFEQGEPEQTVIEVREVLTP